MSSDWKNSPDTQHTACSCPHSILVRLLAHCSHDIALLSSCRPLSGPPPPRPTQERSIDMDPLELADPLITRRYLALAASCSEPRMTDSGQSRSADFRELSWTMEAENSNAAGPWVSKVAAQHGARCRPEVGEGGKQEATAERGADTALPRPERSPRLGCVSPRSRTLLSTCMPAGAHRRNRPAGALSAGGQSAEAQAAGGTPAGTRGVSHSSGHEARGMPHGRTGSYGHAGCQAADHGTGLMVWTHARRLIAAACGMSVPVPSGMLAALGLCCCTVQPFYISGFTPSERLCARWRAVWHSVSSVSCGWRAR